MKFWILSARVEVQAFILASKARRAPQNFNFSGDPFCIQITVFLDSIIYSPMNTRQCPGSFYISFQRVNPKIKIPPMICQGVMDSPNIVTEISTATRGSI